MADDPQHEPQTPSNPLTRLLEAGLQLALTLIAGVLRGLAEAFRGVFGPAQPDEERSDD